MPTVHIDCICPGAPHPGGDDVTLRERLDFRAGRSIYNEFGVVNTLQGGTSFAGYLAIASEQYVIFGVETWTLVDAEGKALPVTHKTIREVLLDDFAAATAVADMADQLYGKDIVAPLMERAASSSSTTPTERPTSLPTNGSARTEPREPSSPSSITTIPTDDTETTSLVLVGVSSSSPNSSTEPSSEPSNGRTTEPHHDFEDE